MLHVVGGRFIEANEVACKRLGRTRKELLGLSLSDIMMPKERPRITRWVGEVLENGECHILTAFRGKNRKSIAANMHAIRCQLDGNAMLLMIWNDDDGSTTPHLSRLEFERFMNHVPAAAFIKDLQGHTLYYNRFMSEKLGANDSWMGKSTVSLFPGPVGEAMHRDDLDAARLGYKEIEESIVCQDGALRDFRTQKFTISCGGDRPPLLGGIAVDITDQKAAVRALAASEVKLRTIFESAGDAIVIIEPDTGRILTVNQRFIDMFGYSRNDVQRMSIRDFQPEQRTTGAENDFREAFSGQPGHGREICLRRKDGSNLAVHITSTALALPEGTLQLGILRDVTDVKRAAEALAASETKFRALFEGASDGIVLVNSATGKIIDVNQRMIEQLGYSREELIGTSAFDLHPREEREFAKSEFQRHASGATSFTAELPVQRKDGSVYYADIGTARLFLAEGLVCVGLFRDVTERRANESAIRDSERRFRVLFNNAPIGIMLVGQGGCILIANKAVERMFGYSNEQLRSMTFLDFTHPEDQQPGLRLFQELFLGERDFFQLEKRYLRADGRTVWARVGIGAIRDQDGIVRHAIGMVEDVTEARRIEQERKTAQVQLLQTQKLESLGVLAGGIAHDFNNLLMTVIGNIEVCMEELPSGSRLMSCIKEIDIASRRGAELCRQMLAYAGRAQPSTGATEINGVILEIVRLLEVSVPKPAKVRYELAQDPPAIWMDGAQLRQVVMNLVLNAADALRGKPGAICIRTGRRHCDATFLASTYVDDRLESGEYVFLEVTDDGCGMDASTKERIFDPFFTTKFAGHGLGLASVLGIVRGHRGAIQVVSEPGKGSTFTVFFPATTQLPTPEEPASEPVEIIEPARVLVIDDEPAVLSVTARHLERSGFQVLSALCGREALNLLAANPDVGLVILDVAMPGMAGDECLAKVRLLNPNIPVIMMSGYDESGVAERLHGVPTAGFLQKPFKRWELMAVVNRVLMESARAGASA